MKKLVLVVMAVGLAEAFTGFPTFSSAQACRTQEGNQATTARRRTSTGRMRRGGPQRPRRRQHRAR